MRYLRTVSTRRLLASIAGVVVAVGGGTAIAVAASSGGPVPPSKPLAQAIHDALGGPAITGITARVTFTNRLIDSGSIQGSDPILTGATGRLWLSPSQHRIRLELQSDNGDAQVVLDRHSFSIYDPTANTVYKGTLPQDTTRKVTPNAAKADTIPTVAQIQADLNKLLQHVNLGGVSPTDVAGQGAYRVTVTPKHDGGLLGSVQLAFDAARGIPLTFAVFAQGSSSPVLQLTASNITFGAVPASDFAATPPSSAKVVTVAVPGGSADNAASGKGRKNAKNHQHVTGPAAVAKRLSFKLVAPARLVGLPRQSVSLLDWSGSPAALVTYGQNLGGIAVIEQKAGSATALPLSSDAGGEHHQGLSLPSVSISPGVSGQELDTALGTMVRFTRGGVTYTVLGSVPAAAADAAARGL
jgi:outer membrane lipoprotein-sorting protein